jgi:hypothetical protein
VADDMGSYEIFLPAGFNHKKFHGDSECGAGAFWLVCTEEQEDFKRYRGVMFAEGKNIPDWIRISIDLGPDYAFVTSSQTQRLGMEEIARQAMKALGGTEMFKDGVKVA